VAKTRTVKRGYKFRFYPTQGQEAEFTRTWGCTRFVYNKALQLKSESWSKDKTNISYEGTSKELTKWKRDPETTWLKEVSSVPLQQALRHLNTAYQNFFDKRSAYPRFKARKRSKLSDLRLHRLRFRGRRTTPGQAG
jgi:putative transposase